MTSHRIFRVLAGVGSAALVLAPAAHGATKTVSLGLPPAAQGQFQAASADADAFFPDTITVHAGDSVKFVPDGFHNVDLPAKGGKPTPLIGPSGGNVSGAKDAAGTPFWFDGKVPNIGFDPSLFKSAFGKSFSYTGAKGVQSGLPLSNHPKPLTIRFPKAGSFTYFCDVHAGMKGTVKVVAKKKPVPSAKVDRDVVRKQVVKALAVAKGLATTKPAANSVSLGASGPGGVEVLAMLPDSLTVPVGTTVSFAMPVGSREDHTATFAPGDPEKQPTSYIGQLAGSFNGPAPDPRAVYASDPPGAPAVLNPTAHGNGFWNSGVLDQVAASPLAPSNSVKFDTAGTYTYYCLIHPFMKGTVKVQ